MVKWKKSVKMEKICMNRKTGQKISSKEKIILCRQKYEEDKNWQERKENKVNNDIPIGHRSIILLNAIQVFSSKTMNKWQKAVM